MDIRQLAEGLFPCWVLGAAMIYLVRNSKYKDLLKVDKQGLWNFAKWLIVATIIRVVYFKMLAPESVIEGVKNTIGMVPWQLMLGVYWEDACNTMALTVMSMMLKKKKWFQKLYMPLMGAMALSFGLGHSYEGLSAVIMMMCYIPITMRLGKKWGFGTVMLCHMAYDLTTYLTLSLLSVL